jgi:hypothetical protein
MPKCDLPGAFNAAARKRNGLEALLALLDEQLTPALKAVRELPKQDDRQFQSELQRSGNEFCLTVFFGTPLEMTARMRFRASDERRPEMQLKASCKEGIYSFEVTNFNFVVHDHSPRVIEWRSRFPTVQTSEFAQARDAFRRGMAGLCPEYRLAVEKAFLSLTSITLFKPLKLKTGVTASGR